MEQGNRPWKASWASESAPLPEISQRSRPTPFRGLSGAYSPAPFCRRVTDLTCGDLRSLTLTPTLPLPTSSSLRDNSYSTGPSLFTTEGGSVAGKSVCSGGFSLPIVQGLLKQCTPCTLLHYYQGASAPWRSVRNVRRTRATKPPGFCEAGSGISPLGDVAKRQGVRLSARKKALRVQGFISSGKRVSNPRPSAWEADALPTELLPRVGVANVLQLM